MFFTPKAKRACLTIIDQAIFPLSWDNTTTNRAFSRRKWIALFCPLPCGVLKQAAHFWFSYGRESQIYDFSSLCWVDKCVS